MDQKFGEEVLKNVDEPVEVATTAIVSVASIDFPVVQRHPESKLN